MKKILSLTCSVFLMAGYAFSGIVINYKIDTKVKGKKYHSDLAHYISGQKSKIVYEFTSEKDKKFEVINITDLKNELVYLVFPENKTYFKMTFKDIEELSKKNNIFIPSSTNYSEYKKVKIKKSDKTEKILGYETTKYNIYSEDKSDKYEGEVWITKEKKLKEAIEYTRGQIELYNKALGNEVKYPYGLVLKYKAKHNKDRYYMEATSVKLENVKESVFDMPKDYKMEEVSMYVEYQKMMGFDAIMGAMKEQMKEAAKEQAKEMGKEIVKEKLKSLLPF